MKKFGYNRSMITSLFIAVILVGCFPETQETSSQQTPMISQTFTEFISPTAALMIPESASQTYTPPPIGLTVVPVIPQAKQTNVPMTTPVSTQQRPSDVPFTPTPTNTLCPPPTPEPLWVDPVVSPTDQLTQAITVYIGNGVEVTLETESGIFTVTGQFNHHTNPAVVEITLLPNTVHHLEVAAKVRSGLTGPGNCTYGSYTLRTTSDRNGAPLIIVQGAATP